MSSRLKSWNGLQGFQGARGSDGIIGVNGVQGPQGIVGKGFVIFAHVNSFNDIGSVSVSNSNVGEFVLVKGGDLYVYYGNNAGSTGPNNSYSYVGDITDESKLNGFQGPQGSIGFQGAVGSGFQGSQGSDGSNGVQGFQGSQGSAGSNGLRGFQGAVGSAGSNGVQGFQGAVGSAGSNGVQGFQGAVGSAGSNGAQGFQGMVGTQGAVGSAGSGGSMVARLSKKTRIFHIFGRGCCSGKLRGGLTSDSEGFKLILQTFDCTSAFDLVSCTKLRRALLMSEEFFINLLNLRPLKAGLS